MANIEHTIEAIKESYKNDPGLITGNETRLKAGIYMCVCWMIMLMCGSV